MAAKQIQIHGNYLYVIDRLKTLQVFHFPSLESVCRFTVDADITTLQLANDVNRIILGDAAGRIHFLQPIGFEI
ncbi:MAG: hypothetical protein ABJA37_12090 [Ferruginibacter sp.]